MAKKVFISYCHKQGDWVWERLVPCLRYGGAEVLIDKERFKAGKAVIGEMDATQDKADIHVLVFSPDYLASSYCKDEMKRSINQDPLFQRGIVIPVLREACILPVRISKHNPIYVNLQDDKNADEWDRLFNACEVDLGCAAPDWLQVRNELVRYLNRKDSVNLVVTGHPKWRELIQHIKEVYLPDLGVVSLASGATTTRRDLVSEMLRASCNPTYIHSEDSDLVVLERVLKERDVSRIVFQYYDLVSYRSYYDIDLFATLFTLIKDLRKLVLVILSRKPFSTLIPYDHPLSSIDLKLVELKGRL